MSRESDGEGMIQADPREFEREAWRAYAYAYLAGAWRSGVDRVEDAADAADAMLKRKTRGRR